MKAGKVAAVVPTDIAGGLIPRGAKDLYSHGAGGGIAATPNGSEGRGPTLFQIPPTYKERAR